MERAGGLSRRRDRRRGAPGDDSTRYGSVRDVLIDLSGVGGALLLARGRMAAREHAQVGPGIGIEPVE